MIKENPNLAKVKSEILNLKKTLLNLKLYLQ